MGVFLRRALCFELPTAGLIIGYIGAFFGICQTINILVNINTFDEDFESKEVNDMRVFTISKSSLLAGLYWAFVLNVLNLTASILLVVGTHKNSHRLLLPWLIFNGIGLGILTVVNFFLFVFGIYYLATGTGNIFLVIAFLVLILTGFSWYIFLIIYSLFYYVRDELRKPPHYDSEAQQYLKVGYNARS